MRLFQLQVNHLFVKFFFFFIVVFSFQTTKAQESSFIIRGQLVDKSTKEYLPYAHVLNTRTKIGSVTDNEGYFGMRGNRIGDTISVSFIGYITQKIVLESSKPMQIYLQENKTILSELTLEYDNSDYLYEIIKKCKKNTSQTSAKGKAYYELHTTQNNKQVELVEIFYNAYVKGYELEELKLKVGKFGVQNNQYGGVNVSLESSVAILKSKLMEEAEHFYENPFQLSYKQLKKQYDLYEVKSFNEAGEKITMIRYSPKDNQSNLFNGMIWLNKNTFEIHKINMECKACNEHPFYMLTNKEIKLKKVDVNLTKTFVKKEDGMVLNHIDFEYSIDYLRDQIDMGLKTNVLVHLYDLDHTFYLPKFNKTNERRHSQDYRAISEAPYNAFFWRNHNEFSVFDKGNENINFFNHPNTIKGLELGKSLMQANKTNDHIFESPSFWWSKKRLRFAETKFQDTTSVGKQETGNDFAGAYNGQFKADMYKFYGKIYLDRNEYNGKVNVLTKSIFDSSRSFYKLPITWKVQAFVNMYFDLVEIERRKLEKQIEESDKSISTINMLYSKSEEQLAKTHKSFLKEVRRGEVLSAMEKWNNLILKELKVDNLVAFIKK
ncbi:MAG: carboxypeptidase-like regulatory domain-containing protein [Flavobacteriales bacterium]